MKKIKRRDPFKNLQLDPEEQELYDSLERGEWKSVGNIEKIRKETAESAGYTLSLMKKAKKDKRVSIRLNKQDLEKVQARAAKNRLPYQTLISTLIHHFAEGKIKLEL